MTTQLKYPGQATPKVAFKWRLAAVFLALAAMPGSSNDDVIFQDGFENRAPVIISTPPTTGKLGAPYFYEIEATDPDGDLLYYELLQSPEGMEMGEFTGEISWTPTEVATVPVEVIVTDGNRGSDQQAWQIGVTEIVDSDGDGLSDEEETTLGTNPNDPDTDNDELNDGEEVFVYTTNPLLFDTDGDDFGDGSELIAGTNPLDAGDFPAGHTDPEATAPDPDPTVPITIFDSTEFLYSGDDPIQTGVEEGAIDSLRAAVIRGRVLDSEGDPLQGVIIAIKDHSEYGQTLSRANGMFDMVVNGGAYLVIDYNSAGYLPAQRKLNIPIQDYVWAPDVVMVTLDPVVTMVAMSAAEMQVARGSEVTDSDGTRQATLLFQPGTTAELLMGDGSTQPVGSLDIRATEYTVGDYGPQGMPAVLPPASGYTYAVEMSADEALAAGATDVLLSQPVYNYVEDFIGFPIGTAVPTGYYDRELAQWVASDNGRVIKILSIAGGFAELDTDGDDVADDAGTLAALNITVAEQQHLAELYTAGQALWRVPMTHFTPWDHNWPFGPPEGATGCTAPTPSGGVENGANSCQVPGSIIECQSQVLGERIPVVGTPYTLNYRSNRVAGRSAARRLQIPLSGDVLHDDLGSIKLEVEIAGQRYARYFPPSSRLTHDFEWDGLDAYGRSVGGILPVTVRISYNYPTVYYPVAVDLERSFAQMSPSEEVVAARAESVISFVRNWKGLLTASKPRLGMGGWSLDIHHSYLSDGQKLYLGDGSERDAENISILEIVAGGNYEGFSGDGGPAVEAKLHSPTGVSVAADGSIYIADAWNNRIRRVGLDGIISTVAGTGVRGYSGDGGLAPAANLAYPTDVFAAADGSLYITDSTNARVRRIDPDGIITTVAGNGTHGYDGDGGPATEAQLHTLRSVTMADDGSLYIATQYRIRRVGPDGIISTVAGKINWPIFNDEFPAAETSLGHPHGVSVAADGSLLIASRGHNLIRSVSVDGIIHTVAGKHPPGGYFSGDGGLATEADLYDPSSAEKAPDGSLYIADTGNRRVRQVTPNGIINTVAGTGDWGMTNDGRPATTAPMYTPGDLSVAADGSVYIADIAGAVIYKLRSIFPGHAASDLAIASSDGSELYHFNSEGRHLRTLNTLNGTTIHEFAYDDKGLLIQLTDGDSNITLIERVPDGTPTAIVGPYGQRTELTLDANGYLAAISNPAGETWQFAYTKDGLLTTSTDPNEHISDYNYDELGRLIRTDDPAGGSQTLARSDFVNAYEVSKTTGLGRVTSYRVENLPTGEKYQLNTFPDGSQTDALIGTDGSMTTFAPDGSTVTLQLGPDPRFGMQAPITESQTLSTPGELNFAVATERAVTLGNPTDLLSLQSQTDTHTVNGRTYTSVFDTATRQITYTSPEGRQVVMTLDARGKVESVATAGLELVEYSYDAQGRLTGVVQGAGASERAFNFSYDPEGYVSSLADLTTRSVDFQYDAAGRVDNLTLPNGSQISHSYDSGGNMDTVTPPGRPAHSFTYTPIGLEASYIPPDIGAGINATSYTYNIDRGLTQLNRPDGASSSLEYNLAGQLDTVTMPHGTVTYEFDALTGNLSKITATDGGFLSYGYDGLLVTRSTLSGTVFGSVSQDYNNDFNITSRRINDSFTVNFTYDQDGLLTQAGDLLVTREAGNWFINGTTLGDVTDSRSHNGFGELTHYTATYDGTDFIELQYARDQVGRITEKTETISGATNTYGYLYDSAGRLIEANRNENTVAAYSYDGNGNRLSYSGSGGSITGTYDGQDRLVQYGSATYTYTDNGELLSKTIDSQTTSYEYDVTGNLMAVTQADGTRIDYIIDGENRRIGKKVNGVLIQGFLYKDKLNPVAELDGDGNVVARFIYGSQTHVPDYMEKAGQVYRIISENLGSPRLVIDAANGTIIQRIDYDEFGNVTTDTNPGFQPFGFAGGLYDPDTGLTRFGLRDYDAETGRWTAKDPIRFSGGDTNLYAYVKNDPTNLFDPWGMDWITPEQGQLIADIARTWVGTPYAPVEKLTSNHSGGNAVKQVAADCSGAAWAIYAEAGFNYQYTGSKQKWPPQVSYLRPAPGNIPQVGDIGRWHGHVLIYDPNAPGKNNAWGARNPEKPFSAVQHKHYGKGPVTWYRWFEPDEGPKDICGGGMCQ